MTKRISGVYLDNQNFKRIVFYVSKGWVMTTYNPEGKYCSHAHYDTKDIKIQISGMIKVS